METSRERMLKEVMAADFYAYDLRLYLNTHPYDYRALTIYVNSVQKSRMLHEAYERMYGPLTAAAANTYPWPWISNPWPWEWQ